MWLELIKYRYLLSTILNKLYMNHRIAYVVDKIDILIAECKIHSTNSDYSDFYKFLIP